MEMKRIEAETLEEAYSKAAKALACSVTEINYEIIQHPTSGVMGLFKKSAIIIAVKKITQTATPSAEEERSTLEEKHIEEESSREIVTTNTQPLTETSTSSLSSENEKDKDIQDLAPKNDAIVDNFFNNEVKENIEVKESKVEVSTSIEKPTEELFFDDDREHPENRVRSIEIENKIIKLMKTACFHIDTVEVDVFNGIAHIFIDGEDAALLIGKEGYRYNALSYMLFNWINAEYDLYIKLEISEFIQAQEEMIDNYLKPIAEHIIEHGRGKTKPLDGILVQIALEKLRAMFPNKYIAIKTGKDGKKFIIINDFNSKKKTVK
jgi:spoIIIJ-associated protein